MRIIFFVFICSFFFIAPFLPGRVTIIAGYVYRYICHHHHPHPHPCRCRPMFFLCSILHRIIHPPSPIAHRRLSFRSFVLLFFSLLFFVFVLASVQRRSANVSRTAEKQKVYIREQTPTTPVCVSPRLPPPPPPCIASPRITHSTNMYILHIVRE